MVTVSEVGLAYARSTEFEYFRRWQGWFMYRVRNTSDSASLGPRLIPDFAASFFSRHYLDKEPITEEDADAFETQVVEYLAVLFDRNQALLPPEPPCEFPAPRVGATVSPDPGADTPIAAVPGVRRVRLP